MEKTHRILHSVLRTFLLTAVLCTGCDKKQEGREAVAWVNGDPIPFSLFWEEVENRYNEVTDPSFPQPGVLETLKKKVLSDLIRDRLLLQEASRREIEVPEEALESRMEEIRLGYAGQPLRKSLAQHFTDYGQWRDGLRKRMILEELFREIVERVKGPTNEEIRVYYEDHSDEFLVPETVEIRQIVVKDRSLADGLLRRIRKREDFASLAGQYSVGPEKEEGGALGTFRRGDLPGPLESAAFSTAAGKVSAVVETSHGYHILKVEKKVPSRMCPLEEVNPEIVRRLFRQKQDAFYARWVKALISKSDIQVHGSLVHMMVDVQPVHQAPLPERGRP